MLKNGTAGWEWEGMCLVFVLQYGTFCQILFLCCNHLAEEERAVLFCVLNSS